MVLLWFIWVDFFYTLHLNGLVHGLLFGSRLWILFPVVSTDPCLYFIPFRVALTSFKYLLNGALMENQREGTGGGRGVGLWGKMSAYRRFRV